MEQGNSRLKQFLESFNIYLESKGTSLEEFLHRIEIDDECGICPVCDEVMFTVTLEAPVGDIIISNAINHFGCLTILSALKQYVGASMIVVDGTDTTEEDILSVLARVLATEDEDGKPEYPFKN